MNEEEYEPVDPRKLPLIAVGLIFAYFISMAVFMIPFIADKPKGTEPTQFEMFSAMAMNAVFWIAACMYVIPKIGLPKIEETELKIKVKYFFAGIILVYASLILFNIWLLFLKERFGYDPGLQDVAKKVKELPSEYILLLIITPVTLIPIIEEILFRGVLYRALRKNSSVVQATLLSSFAFAVVHLEPHAMPPLFMLAIIFAWTYEKTGSLTVPILLHASNNFLTVVMLLTNPSP